MNERHPSGITRDPPPVTRMPYRADPLLRTVTLVDGRIAWPTIFQYEFGGAMHDCPPIEKALAPVAIDSVERRMGQFRSIPSTVPFEFKVYDLPAFEWLSRNGYLRDPQHTGVAS